MKKIFLVAVLAWMPCCAFTCTSVNMVNAAKVEKTFSTSLKAFQDTETAAFNKQLISPATHQHFAAAEEALASDAQKVDIALLSNNKAGALAAVNTGLAAVNGIEMNDVGSIGDLTTRGAVEVATQGLINLLTQIQTQLGG